MNMQAISIRLVALAAVLFIAVLVWRVGSTMMFNDHDDYPDGAAAGAPSGTSADGAESTEAGVVTPVDGRFTLTPANAHQRSESLRIDSRDGSAALAGWRNAADHLVWRVQIDSVRDGYWRAIIRYRSMQSLRIQLQSEGKRLAIWTLPEARELGVEEKWIRLIRPGVHSLTLSPTGDATSLAVIDLVLVPR